jgi:hypothetical protein
MIGEEGKKMDEAVDKDFSEVQGYLMESLLPDPPFQALSRLVKLARRAPSPGSAAPAARIPTRIERNEEGHRCAICDGTYAHVHGYDAQGEVPGMFDGSRWGAHPGSAATGREGAP